jgi:predicted ATPase
MPRIERLIYTREQSRDGLDEIRMSDLGPVVLLAGPNGSGKSRLLGRLANLHVTGAREDLELRLADVYAQAAAVSATGENISLSSDHELMPFARETRKLEGEIEALPDVGNYAGRPLRGSVSHGALRQASETRDGERKGLPEGLRSGWTPASMHEHALAYIRVLSDRYKLAHSSVVPVPDAEKAHHEQAFRSFCKMCRELLGFEPELSLDPPLLLNGRDFDQAGYSPGQVALLQLAVVLDAQTDHVADKVVLLDEPEQHLHPRALREVFDRLHAATKDHGQLWIATHSVHLLAHVDPKAIWFVDNGTVSRAGSSVTKVLEGLVGEQEEIEKLARFLLLPAEHAAILFATQCLGAPGVEGPNDVDPQTKQIADALESLREKRGGKLRLLDYGAGVGRLLDHLYAKDRQAVDHYEYVGFERNDANRAQLIGTLARHDLAATCALDGEECDQLAHGARKFDVVVMCNVVHEIDPEEWPEVFTHVANILDPCGFLLIVEDQCLPTGERAHASGFVVLGKVATTALFHCADAEGFSFGFQHHKGETQRLSAALVPRSHVSGVTHARGAKALDAVRRAARSALKAMEAAAKDKKADLKAGRAYAFHTFQFANATRALEKSCFADQLSAAPGGTSDPAA